MTPAIPERGPHKARGVTLLELLLAMTLLGIALAALAQYFIGGLRVTATITDQTRLQEDLRATGSIIGDEVQRALYVFPPGSRFDFSASDFAGIGNALTEPKTNTRVWEVGSSGKAPMLAMIVAPQDPGIACAKHRDGCYEFVSYHPVKRERLVRGQFANTGQDALEPDSGNDDRWALVEYRVPLTATLNPTNGNPLTPDVTQRDWPVTAGTTTARVPRIPWGDVGCGAPRWSQPCPKINDPTTPDPPPVPDLNRQQTPSSIPATCKDADASRTLSFSTRMAATRRWLETRPGQARILFEHVRPGSGFAIALPADARGASEVQMKLQAGFNTRGREVLVPGVPLEFVASPRNLPGVAARCVP